MTSTLTTQKVQLFKGAGWEECDAFVRSIREVAWNEDKSDDDRWIANYASFHFSGKALKWHSRLPPDIRRDWSKLEVALLDQWPAPCDDEDAEVSTVPTPAAAPDHLKNKATQERFQSVVKVVSHNTNSQFYLGYPHEDGGLGCGLTKEIKSAMRVSVDVENNPHIIEVSPKEKLQRHDYFWAAIHWNGSDQNLQIKPDSTDSYARIALIDSVSLESSYYSEAPFRIVAWDVSVEGEIIPTWFQPGERKTVLNVSIDEHDLDISIIADPVTNAERFPDEVMAQMYLQRLN